MKFNLGYTQNIVYDLERGVLTKIKEVEDIVSLMTFKDAARVMYYYNKTSEEGLESQYALKLYYVIIDLLKEAYNKKYGVNATFKDIINLGARIQ